MPDYRVEKMSVRAEIDLEDGQPPVDVPLTRFQARWALNDIPQASLSIALGRNMADFLPSPIHRLIVSLRVRRRVRVWATVTRTDQEGADDRQFYPQGEFLLFDGWTTGPGYNRSSTGAAYTISVEHWLAGLNHGSAISATSSPQNPVSLIYPAASDPVTTDPEVPGGAENARHMIGDNLAARFFPPDVVTTDLWGDGLEFGIRAWLASLASQDSIIDVPEVEGIVDPDLTGNPEAVEALARFEPLVIPPNVNAAYIHGSAIRVDPDNIDDTVTLTAADNIANMLAEETYVNVATSTLWEKLLAYASTLLVGVVPQVGRALVVPLIAGLRTPYRVIESRDSEVLNWTGTTPRLLRGVGIYGGYAAVGGLAMGDGPDFEDFTIGGRFVVEGVRGEIRIKQAPPWLRGEDFALEGVPTAGAGAEPIATAVDPDFVGPPDDRPAPREVQHQLRSLLDRFAEALYANEVFRGRQGDVASIFRTDIGPGSTVEVEAAGEAFVGPEDQLNQSFFGTVVAVDITLDSDQATARTAFHLAHIRSPLENSSPGTGLERHPMWVDVWKGAPLTEGLARIA